MGLPMDPLIGLVFDFQNRVHHTTNSFFELCLKIILDGHSFPLFMITDERRFSQPLRSQICNCSFAIGQHTSISPGVRQ